MDLDGLDWIVCHSGADIWHAQSDGEWNADDQWENLIDFRYTSWLFAFCLQQGIPIWPAAGHPHFACSRACQQNKTAALAEEQLYLLHCLLLCRLLYLL